MQNFKKKLQKSYFAALELVYSNGPQGIPARAAVPPLKQCLEKPLKSMLGANQAITAVAKSVIHP